MDDDELSFVAGDLITVGAWDSPDEQVIISGSTFLDMIYFLNRTI